MNQVFDFKRWLLLVGKHWSENRKKYILSLAAILALMVIWYSFVLMLEPKYPFPEEMQVATYYIGLAITGCLFGSLFFSELSSGPKAMHFLSVPASAFEKLLIALFYCVILFFVCYTAIFYLVDFTMVSIANGLDKSSFSRNNPSYVFKPIEVANVFSKPLGASPNTPPYFLYFLILYINLQAAFILGSIYFPAYSFIKTCITLLLVFLFGVFLIGTLLDSMMPSGSFYDGIFSYVIYEEGSPVMRGVRLSEGLSAVLKYLAMFGFLPLLWSAAYFRLKEKEV